MRKIIILVGSVVLIGLLSGCGNNFKCDNKDYAEQALNILLFGDAKGSNDKKITLKSLGFDVSEITLMELDKDKNSSICKANIINKNAEKAIALFKESRKSGEKPHFDETTEALANLGFSSKGVDGMLGGVIGGELLKNLNIPKEEMTQETLVELLGVGFVALKLHAHGLAYRTYDNGNGDLMIEADFAK
ncbi:MAG: hypothetical protein J1E28_01015 [Helicobacter sp.]|uniref:hypothetical protein n=1 Tax=Helicobacter sp. TaxID=218 RepID=UPI0025BAEB67|nr:hypothetical protein [Helicobacter sp.]MCH5312970.1 hypothetical protein [Helicobacter sp.]